MLRTLFSGFVGGMPLNAVAFVPPYRPYAPGAVALDKTAPEPWERRCETPQRAYHGRDDTMLEPDFDPASIGNLVGGGSWLVLAPLMPVGVRGWRP